MGTTPILEMARAYGLRPRLWLLVLQITLAINLKAPALLQKDAISAIHTTIEFSVTLPENEMILTKRPRGRLSYRWL